MPRTYVILDGLSDPALGLLLSRRWMAAGLRNGVDVAGQAGWLDSDEPMTESQMGQAAAIARTVGVELRDRAGAEFKPDNQLDSLRERVVYEFRSRFATGLMYGLPALLLHWLAPLLASGGGTSTRAMAFPWVFELALSAWVIIAAGWPILWQGALALRRLRLTPDLFTSMIVLAAWVPSAVGVIGLSSSDPWLKARGEGGPGVMFHVAIMAILLATYLRWQSHRHAPRLAGKAMLMIPRAGRLLGLALITALVLGWLRGWAWGLAVALTLTPAIALAAVNRWSPGWTTAMPWAGFVVFFIMAPRAWSLDIGGVEAEVAAVFQLIMAVTAARGWAQWPLNSPPPPAGRPAP